MDLEKTKLVERARGSMLRTGALLFFGFASVLLISSLASRHAASSELNGPVSVSSTGSATLSLKGAARI